MSTAQALTLRLFSCRLTTSSSTSLESRDLEGKMAAAVEQERYAFSRRSGYDTCTYGGCQSRFPHSGFPTAVELQIQPAAAVLGAGVPGAALARTRVVPVASPGGSRSSSVPGWSCRDSGPSSNFRAQSSTTQNRRYWEPIGALMAPVEAVISLVKALVIQMEAAKTRVEAPKTRVKVLMSQVEDFKPWVETAGPRVEAPVVRVWRRCCCRAWRRGLMPVGMTTATETWLYVTRPTASVRTRLQTRGH